MPCTEWNGGLDRHSSAQNPRQSFTHSRPLYHLHVPSASWSFVYTGGDHCTKTHWLGKQYLHFLLKMSQLAKNLFRNPKHVADQNRKTIPFCKKNKSSTILPKSNDKCFWDNERKERKRCEWGRYQTNETVTKPRGLPPQNKKDLQELEDLWMQKRWAFTVK